MREAKKKENIGKRCGAESLNILYRSGVRSFVFFYNKYAHKIEYHLLVDSLHSKITISWA